MVWVGLRSLGDSYLVRPEVWVRTFSRCSVLVPITALQQPSSYICRKNLSIVPNRFRRVVVAGCNAILAITTYLSDSSSLVLVTKMLQRDAFDICSGHRGIVT